MRLIARKINDSTYLKYLLQSLNVDELKGICRSFSIKGFSSKKKAELIEFILTSLSEEEVKDVIKDKTMLNLPRVFVNGALIGVTRFPEKISKSLS